MSNFEKPPHFYGRRKGRPLLKSRQELMESLFPSLQVTLDNSQDVIDPRTLFEGNPQDVWLEIGFGGGEHLAYQAVENPSVGILGAEAFVNGVASLVRHVHLQQLSNVRIYQGDVRLLLPRLKSQSISRLFILFPDPWPKTRHFKRRLICPESLEIFHRLLAPGGVVRVASDDPSYSEWIIQTFKESPLFSMPKGARPDWSLPPKDWTSTRYEQKAKRAGRLPVYLDFKRLD